MSVIWIIEHFDNRNGFQNLAKALNLKGIHLLFFDQTKDKRPNLNKLSLRDTVIFHGSLELEAELKALNKPWQMLSWGNYRNFNCSFYYPKLEKFLFNRNYRFLTLAEVEDSAPILLESGSFFLRPDSGIKTFSGRVLTAKTFEKDWKIVNFYTPAKETLCLISNAKPILKEFRFVCLKGEIITGCTYKDESGLVLIDCFPIEALKVAEEIASNFSPDELFMIDICQSPDGFYLLELNPFSTSAIYSCNPGIITEKVTQFVLGMGK